MTIREFAKSRDFEIVGKLKRDLHGEYEIGADGVKRHTGFKCYLDEAGNEYYIGGKAGTCCIVTADGAVL